MRWNRPGQKNKYEVNTLKNSKTSKIRKTPSENVPGFPLERRRRCPVIINTPCQWRDNLWKDHLEKAEAIVPFLPI